jgi:hypothetical protein
VSNFLELSFDSTEQELRGIANLGSPFLVSRHQIDQLVSSLRSIHSERSVGTHHWQVPTSDPIRTRSTRSYRSGDDHGRQTVFAEISMGWELNRLTTSSSSFRVTQASALARVYEVRDDGNKLAAAWRMESGAGSHPGAFFHVQVEAFSSFLEIPRFPFTVPTPATCIEFLIAELFQDEWKQHLAQRSAPSWELVQRRRIERWLDWQKAAVTTSSGSPWLALKSAAPGPTTFL